MAELTLATDAVSCHHLLVVSGQVGRSDVEALAVSHFPEVFPQDEYTFAVSETFSISGAYSIAEEVRRELDIPAWAEIAFVAHVPIQRGAPLPNELIGLDPIWDTYRDGLPLGEEDRALRFFRAAARRLGGALILAGGIVVVPNPDESADLALFSPIWLDPETLQTHLIELLGQTRTSLDDAQDYRLPEEVILDAYACYQTVPGGTVNIEVHSEKFLPLSVAAFDWAAEGAVRYDLRYLPDDERAHHSGRLTVGQRHERAGAAQLIEAIARAIQDIAPGVIADNDGFLVELPPG